LKAILLVAHGSRRPESNAEVFELARQLKSDSSINADIVGAAFLDIAEPSIPEGIRKCVDLGATSITLLPYFLNSGRHVISDIPEIVSNIRKEIPQVSIKIAPHLGESGLMTDLLMRILQSMA